MRKHHNVLHHVVNSLHPQVSAFSSADQSSSHLEQEHHPEAFAEQVQELINR